MAKLSPLNDRQRQVLERIVEGTRPVTRLDSSLSVTVNALSSRKLAVKKKTPGGGWIAVPTQAGRDFLLGKSPDENVDEEPLAPPAVPVVHEPTRVQTVEEWQTPTTPPQPPRFEAPLTYTVDEAAHVLGVGPSWLRARANGRDFPHVRLGRRIVFTGPQLLAILEACTRQPLPNHYFNNPWGLAARSHSLKAARANAAAAERTAQVDDLIARKDWGRPVRGRKRQS